MRASVSQLRRLRVLATRARIYYGMHGPLSTVRKVLAYVAGRQPDDAQAGPVQLNFTGLSPGEIVVPHTERSMLPVGALTGEMTVAQYIELGFDALHELELLLGTYSRTNTNKNRVALYSEAGELLHYEEFRSHEVVDNAFHALKLGRPLQLKSRRGVWLILSSDGTRDNCITAWKSEEVSTGLYAFAESFETVRGKISGLREERTALITGTLVYRIRGARSASSPVYRLPPYPEDFERRLGKDRLRTAAYLAGDAAMVKRLRERVDAGRVHVTGAADGMVKDIEAGEVDLVILAGIVPVDEARAICRAAALRYVPTVYLLDEATLEHARRTTRTGDLPRTAPFEIAQALCWTSFCAAEGEAASALAVAYRKRLLPAGQAIDARAVLAAYRRNCRPLVSIVTILYRKAEEIPAVLDSYVRQSYGGPIEVVFVDDCSPDGSVAAVEDYVARARAKPEIRLPEIRIVRNERNAGNCLSRNAGIALARGEILLVVDADCVLNKDCIQKHVEAHAFDDCEVVIGPLNIETNGGDPLAVLRELERRPDLVSGRSNLQDPINPRSFLNCITRNFSVKREAAGEALFDPLFTYSEDPASGFGWEDVEMGYRLYLQGARIKFVDEAFSIHITPTRHEDDATKAARSMRNFRRLFLRHRELELAARRWVVETTQELLRWGNAARTASGEDRAFLERDILGKSRPIPWGIAKRRRLRILTYRWHVPHQYELYKLPFEFTLATGTGTPMCDTWEFGQRPMPANARFVPVDKIDPRDYDLAILHFDENVLAPHNTNGVIGSEWSKAFKWLHEQRDLPKIAVCHGTPQFHGQYDIRYAKPDLMQPIEAERRRLVEYLGDIPVVVNSHQAQREWAFHDSRVIWHGFDPAEFPPATYERGILSPLGPLVLSRPHYRGYFLYKAVFSDDYPAQLRPETLKVPEPHVLYSGNAYAAAKYRNYVDEIRRYTAYFNPTLRSPMPRARGEPMMCGVVTVSARNHDVDMFVENGVNGFHSNDPGELRDALLFLMRNPDAARRIGEAGRRTAMDVFNHDRYLSDWLGLLENVLGSAVQRPALRLHAGGRR